MPIPDLLEEMKAAAGAPKELDTSSEFIQTLQAITTVATDERKGRRKKVDDAKKAMRGQP